MKTLLVAHDAGGAEILCAWLGSGITQQGIAGPLPNSASDCRVVAAGPAARIFQRESVPVLSPGSLTITDFERVITGTSYGATLENEFIQLAREQRVHSISVLDHWLHYPERFRNYGYQTLPNEIWTCDAAAFNLAEDFFPDARVMLKPNWYWERIRRQVTAGYPGHYLVALENRQLRGQTWRDSIEEILHWLNQQKDIREITIRPHPTMERSEIQQYLADKLNLPFAFSVANVDLIQDLSSCCAVVGYQTTVLALARVCGKRAISLVNADERLVIPLAGIEQPFH